jgi:hypothetical protein
MKYIHIKKDQKNQRVEEDQLERYISLGWEPVTHDVTVQLKAPKKTVKPEPAVAEGSAQEEVGDDNKGA